jgi:hypothetical protein
MGIFKNLQFCAWAEKHRVKDLDLLSIILEIRSGIMGSSLGGCLYKKRIPIRSKGKRGGARMIYAYKNSNKIFFLYGYTKSQMENITIQHKIALKDLGDFYFKLSDAEIDIAIKNSKLFTIGDN